MQPVSPPPRLTLPIIRHLVEAYKIWHEFLPHVPKDSRYTLGIKIDRALIATVEFLFLAGYTKKEQKLPYLERAATQLDLTKFFLQILWEIKGLDDKKYITLSEKLTEGGNMLGGWMRQTAKKETPATKE
jgi:hypothetical protein